LTSDAQAAAAFYDEYGERDEELLAEVEVELEPGSLDAGRHILAVVRV
jgi:hypothetical protein